MNFPFKIQSDNSPPALHIKKILPEICDLEITVGQIFRAQGSNPDILIMRRPELALMTEKAIRIVMEMAEPQVFFRVLPIKKKNHTSIHLTDSVHLRGVSIERAIRPADSVLAALFTIGPKVEKYVSDLFNEDPAFGMAMDTAASHYVDRMGAILCQAVDIYVQTIGEKTGIPISPGSKDWDVKIGQPQIFSLFSEFNLPIMINSSGMMSPHKSMSMLVPYGKSIGETGKPCDFCSMSATCKFKVVV